MGRTVDLRTDTSSYPTEEMRDAMRRAEVGNDGFAEDPTVNRLEEMAADRLGKEAALFVTSGTMGNLLGVMTSASAGKGVVAGAVTHIGAYEAIALSQFAGLYTVSVDDSSGRLDPEQLEETLSRRRPYGPLRVLCVENTHNVAGGIALPPEEMARYVELARREGLRLHLDGARIFNAAVALNVGVKELVEGADSVMFCLSKGLCAPVGSMLVSDEETVREARRIRGLMGGQMRQAGMVAAAGIVALERMMDRLEEDHRRARRLAEGLARIEGLDVLTNPPQTNIVLVDPSPSGIAGRVFAERLSDQGTLAIAFTDRRVRYVTYRDTDDEDVEYAIACTENVMNVGRRA